MNINTHLDNVVKRVWVKMKFQKMDFNAAFLSSIKDEIKYTRYYNNSEGRVIRHEIRCFYHQNI
jgi:hypothetical protein